ncbi:hypothetical protein [Catenulispora subtropica]|uniref:hypothetical protein n=1 Tax=Catenulispora subtropica TaxID=450798 RepID=UPI0031E3DC47
MIDLAPRLAEAAEDLEVGVPPLPAIVAGGRARRRRRAAGATALGAVTAGAVVAVGLAQLGGGGAAKPAVVPPGGVVAPTTPVPAPAAGPGTAADPFRGAYGTWDLASGELGGATWHFTRMIRPGTDDATDGSCSQYPLVDDTYVETGKGETARTSHSFACAGPGGEDPPWKHTTQFAAGPLAGLQTVDLGAKGLGKPGLPGSMVVGLIDETRIAQVRMVFSDGRPAATAQLVKAPEPERGTYFLLVLPGQAAGPIQPGMLEFFDAAGDQVPVPTYH